MARIKDGKKRAKRLQQRIQSFEGSGKGTGVVGKQGYRRPGSMSK